jgi:hypothetical protein
MIKEYLTFGDREYLQLTYVERKWSAGMMAIAIYRPAISTSDYNGAIGLLKVKSIKKNLI